jgi:uncharacterized protein (DUF305 family)
MRKIGLYVWAIASIGVSVAFVPSVWGQQPAQTPPTQTMPMQGGPGQPGMMGGQEGMHGMGQAPGAVTGPADQAMMQSMQKMQQDMTGKPLTGNADQDFVAMMIPHHQGAIDMARVELQYGKDPMLRRMARGIITAQDKEIREMQQWQSRHSVTR